MRLSLFILLSALPAIAQEWQREKLAALDASLAAGIRRKTTALDNTAVDNYIQSIGNQLAAQSPSFSAKCVFTMVKDEVGGKLAEPIALPGGSIFVPANLVLAAQSEAELAGMLAHAMAHVAEGFRHVTRARMVNHSGVPLIFSVAFTGGDHEAASTLIPSALLGARRQLEIESDVLATRMMSDAGYDPRGLVQYIVRIQRDDSRQANPRSALPLKSDRIATMEMVINRLPAATDETTSEFFKIQQEVRRLLRVSVAAPPPRLRQ